MKDKRFRLLELLLLFVVFPCSLPLNYPLFIKMFIGLSGFGYIVWILLRVERIDFLRAAKLPWKLFWKRILITLPPIIVSTTIYVWYFAPQHLFYVPLAKPVMFFGILLIYSLFSVWPQEILYRTFFFLRYGDYFKSKPLLIIVNATLFSLAHIFFRNSLVLVLTFLGGLLFGLTYLKFKSTTLVTIEHAVYGNWLFTIGMGEMLGFPA